MKEGVKIIDSKFIIGMLIGLAIYIVWRLIRWDINRVGKNDNYSKVDYSEITEDLHELTPRKFEFTVAETLKDYGYQNVQVTPYISDFGADIIAEQNGIKYAIEVKKYSEDNLVGRPALQKLQGAMIHYDADRCIFVTLSDFTEPARSYADQHNIRLINGNEFSEMYEDNWE